MDQHKVKGVFHRLSDATNDMDVDMAEAEEEDSNAHTQNVRFSGLGQVNSSVFARLGGKSDEDGDMLPSSRVKTSPGILKKNPTPPVVRKRLVGNQIVSVKKVPAKAATMVADEMDRLPSIGQRLVLSSTHMDHDNLPGKSVKFSAEDEVVEIDSRRVLVKPKLRAHNIRLRLGGKTATPRTTNGRTPVLSALHMTRKTIKLKSGGSGISSRLGTGGIATSKVKLLKYGSLRSAEDLVQQTVQQSSVHSRLDMPKKAEALAHRVGRVSLDNGAQKDRSNAGVLATKKKSVFNRLGFGK